ncbi:hypothetical protein D5086_031416 [Populus alba]|uniref:Uncharacterized protein n=1 Tax=Populus alba TaxID=43335 RepID=A0ACC4AIK9_POPAL
MALQGGKFKGVQTRKLWFVCQEAMAPHVCKELGAQPSFLERLAFSSEMENSGNILRCRILFSLPFLNV